MKQVFTIKNNNGTMPIIMVKREKTVLQNYTENYMELWFTMEETMVLWKNYGTMEKLWYHS